MSRRIRACIHCTNFPACADSGLRRGAIRQIDLPNASLIRRQPCRHFSAEDKIRILLEGLRGDDSIAGLCRQESIAQSLYYAWSKEFME